MGIALAKDECTWMSYAFFETCQNIDLEETSPNDSKQYDQLKKLKIKNPNHNPPVVLSAEPLIG